MSDQTAPKSPSRKGKLQGQKRPFSPDDLRTIRTILSNKKNWRDLALFCVAIDTMLRSSDILSLRVDDITDHDGNVLEQFTHRQSKTGRGVLVGLTTTAQKSVAKWIEEANKMPWEYLFTSYRSSKDKPLTTGHYRRLVKDWAQMVSLDARHYSGHSTRRTKASLVFRKTGNPETVRQLLGHSSIANTSEYLNISAESAVRQGLEIEV